MDFIKKVMYSATQRLLSGRSVPKRYRAYRLRPSGTIRGHMLLSMATRVYERIIKGEPLETGHIAAWHNLSISRTFLELGFVVDVMNWNDLASRPEGKYDVLIDVTANLERLSEYVGDKCIKILHPMFAHWLVHNTNTYSRHAALLRRRGVALSPRRLLLPSNSAEIADHIILRGGPFGNETYSYGPARMHHIPPLHPFGIDEFLDRDMEKCRGRFLWLGGAGCVHKGLDLTLEVFKDLPDCELYVCGRISDEADFESLYRRELMGLPNIKTIGWIDTTSQQWKQIASRCAAIILPSASEFSCGSVIAAMRTGLIPIITTETSIDLTRVGEPIDGSLKSIENAVCSFREQVPSELLDLSRAVHAAAHRRYDCRLYLDAYRETICEILGLQPLEPWTPWDGHLQTSSIKQIEFPST